MYYKLSNTAQSLVLEKEFGIPLKYANLYRPAQVINGLNEETLTIITCENNDSMVPAIWGILPEDFMDDWTVFQNISNTLNLSGKDFYEGSWFMRALDKRRCLILVTGFFTGYLHQGTIYPYYVQRADKKPFCLAGIYNRLEDGFLTCSLITCTASQFIRRIQNLGTQMPLVLDIEAHEVWLDHHLGAEAAIKMLDHSCNYEFKAHLIAKEFFNNNITFESILEPASYKDLPQVLKT